MYRESIVFNGELSHIIEHMMYLAAQDASQMGYGYNDMINKNTAWVLSRFSLNLDSVLVKEEEYDIMTESLGTNGLFYYRTFEIFNSSNDKCGNAASMWIIIDIKKRMPMKDYLGKFKYMMDERDIPSRIKHECNDGEMIKTITVDESHIDINGHTNSVNYIKWMIDAVSPVSIGSLEIEYMKECFAGDRLDLYVKHIDNKKIIVFLKRINDGRLAVGAKLSTWPQLPN